MGPLYHLNLLVNIHNFHPQHLDILIYNCTKGSYTYKCLNHVFIGPPVLTVQWSAIACDSYIQKCGPVFFTWLCNKNGDI